RPAGRAPTIVRSDKISISFSRANGRSQAKGGLTRFKARIAALEHAPLTQRLKQRKLIIVGLRKRGRFCVAVKLLVLFLARSRHIFNLLTPSTIPAQDRHHHS